MERIELRNMYDLLGRKVVLLCLLFCFVSLSSVDAQSTSKGNYNYLDFQKKPYYFGIHLGLNYSGYKLGRSKNFIGNDSIEIVESAPGAGFNLQGIVNFKIGEFFDFRLLPGFSFTERQLAYTSPNESAISKIKVESVFVELPFLVRFKSQPYKDKRVFVVTGMKYSYDVQSNADSRDAESLVRISPHDFQFEIGAGVQFFYPYFIFSPEIKFSRGITNTLIYNDALNQARVLEDVSSSVFTISFSFEG